MRLDPHVHTSYSGHSLLRVQDLPKLARRKGLDAIAITDHDEIAGAIALSKMFPTIIGEEITCDEGDVIGLFLTERIKGGSALEVMDRIRSQGGLVLIPHPFDSMRKEALMDEELCANGDIIEVFNSRVVRRQDNERAVEFAKSRNMLSAVGSDAHTSMEIGRSWMELESISDPQSFMRSLRDARTHTARSPVLVHVQTKLLKLWRR